MFTVGMNDMVDTFFAASTFLIAIPTGIKIFNWVATLYGGRLQLRTPMLFALGFLSMFLIGGLTGIMLSVVPLAMAANTVRVMVTVIAVPAWGDEVAQGLLHETFGVSTYILGTLAVLGITRLLR